MAQEIVAGGPPLAETRAGEDGRASLREIAGMLRAKLGVVVLSVAVALGLALAYVGLATPQYRATTTLLIDPRSGVAASSEQGARLGQDQNAVESQVRLISSAGVLQRVVEREQLTHDPEFAATGRVGAWLREIGVLPAPAVSDEERRRQQAIGVLFDKLKVKRSERTSVVEVEVLSADPRKAARLADAVAEAYLDDNADARASVTQYEGRWVKRRLDELERKIRDAEERVEVFKETNRIYGANGRLVNEQQLADLNNQLAQARTRTSEAKARHDRAHSMLAARREPDEPGDGQRSPVLDRLRLQYAEIARQLDNLSATLGPRHPQIQEVRQQLAGTRRLIAEEIRRIAQAARNEYAVTRAQEEAIEAKVEGLKRESATTNQAIVRLRELEREVESSRAVYDRFLRASGNVAQEAIDTPVARVIAPAMVPLKPASPRTAAVLLLALAGGLGLGIGAALLSHQFGRRGAVTAAAGQDRPEAGPDAPGAPDPDPRDPPPSDPPPAPVPDVAVFVPRIAGVEPGRGRPAPSPTREKALLTEAIVHPGSAFAQAVGELRDALPRRPSGTAATVLVTSDEPGCGKSVLAANLAWSCAAAGRRVLLVDAHPARPTLARAFASGRPAGYLNAWGAWRPMAAHDRGTRFGLVVVPLDPAAAVPAAKARSASWRIERLHDAFDLVIVDAPALAADPVAGRMVEAAEHVILVSPPMPDLAPAGDDAAAFAVLMHASGRTAAAETPASADAAGSLRVPA